MPRDATPVHPGSRILADGRQLIGYTAFLFCGRVMPVIWAGFGAQLLTITAADVIRGWGVAARELAAPLAMAPAGLLLGAAIGRAAGGRVDPVQVLVWAGLAASLATGATALAGTPTWLGATRLLASTAGGLSIVMAGRLASRLVPAGHLVSVSAVTATLLAVGCLLATWLAGTGLARDWRALFAAAGLVGLTWPLLLRLVSPGAAPDFPAARAGSDGDTPAAWGQRVFGARGLMGALIGVTHARETLSLFALACLNAIVGGMALLVLPLVLTRSDSSRPDAITALWMVSAAAAAGSLTIYCLCRPDRDRWALRALTSIAAAAAWTLAARGGVLVSPAVTIAALVVCGGALASTQLIALRLAGQLGPPGAHAAVVSATTAFTALGALLGPFAGIHASTAGGRPSFFATWVLCLSLATVAAAALPAAQRRPASRQNVSARASGIPA